MAQDKVKLTIQTTVDIPQQRIADIICTAMETACGYWTQVTDSSSHPAGDYYDRFFNDGWVDFGLTDEMVRGCPGECECGNGWHLEEGAKVYRLDLDSIKRGIKLMAEKYGRHYGDFMAENHDAETADVFLQCCLLGEIVYG